jgi:Ca-activated chloride channel family protein
LQGKKLDYKDVKPANLVLLIDASGSMADENKLPLLKKSLALLLDNLSAKDRVALVAYAGSAGLILPSTPANQKGKILSALDNLQAGGSTAGGQGIELAYQVAAANRIEDGNNRVILCTDGDFNVGVSSPDELVKLITEKRKQAIYVTICGFGMGNYKDQTMELISQHGNGNYFYIDNLQEAKKVFVTEMRANLFTIAKDVKLQLEFNPAQVKAYRLVGYENRVMRNEDFDDDTKDAGELGAGHSVTALYELIPAGSKEEVASIKSLKYQTQTSEITRTALQSNEVMSLKMRYKSINSNTSKLIEQSVMKSQKTLNQSSENFKFSAAVAGFGLLLRDSKYKNTLNYAQVLQLAKGSVGRDAEGHRQEFLELVKKAQDIQ